MTDRPTFHIDNAGADGVPESAHCHECGGVWTRPKDDRYADSLPTFARTHWCEPKETPR